MNIHTSGLHSDLQGCMSSVVFVIFEKAALLEPYGEIVKHLYHRSNNSKASCHLDELQYLQFNAYVTATHQRHSRVYL